MNAYIMLAAEIHEQMKIIKSMLHLTDLQV